MNRREELLIKTPEVNADDMERRAALRYMNDCKNILGFQKDIAVPADDAESKKKAFFVHKCRNEYLPFKTFQEEYSKKNYNPSILEKAKKYIPEEIQQFNEKIRQLNLAVEQEDFFKIKQAYLAIITFIDECIAQAAS